MDATEREAAEALGAFMRREAVKTSAAHAEGRCRKCGHDALARCYSDAGRREYAISGMCELCFDDLFAE